MGVSTSSVIIDSQLKGPLKLKCRCIIIPVVIFLGGRGDPFNCTIKYVARRVYIAFVFLYSEALGLLPIRRRGIQIISFY